jgi:dihydropteroate synthase
MATWMVRTGVVLPGEGRRCALLGILNATPDSFSDGGRWLDPGAAAARAEQMAAEGADALDVGGESTRPGSVSVPEDEQIARVVPVIRAIRGLRGIAGTLPISIDTTRAGVARAAMDAGADAINDQSAGRDDAGMLPLAASRGAGVILMHRAVPPELDRYSDRYDRPPEYVDVVDEVAAFLSDRAAAAERSGVARASIAIDPGLGFGKSVEQNLALIDGTPRLAALGYAVVSGLSRKSFVGRMALVRDSRP